jgi:hypothetical protein
VVANKRKKFSVVIESVVINKESQKILEGMNDDPVRLMNYCLGLNKDLNEDTKYYKLKGSPFKEKNPFDELDNKLNKALKQYKLLDPKEQEAFKKSLAMDELRDIAKLQVKQYAIKVSYSKEKLSGKPAGTSLPNDKIGYTKDSVFLQINKELLAIVRKKEVVQTTVPEVKDGDIFTDRKNSKFKPMIRQLTEKEKTEEKKHYDQPDEKPKLTFGSILNGIMKYMFGEKEDRIQKQIDKKNKETRQFERLDDEMTILKKSPSSKMKPDNDTKEKITKKQTKAGFSVFK